MSAPKHTPGPWRANSNGNVWVGVKSCNSHDTDYGASDSTRGIDRHAICETFGPQATENAEFIALACNAYEPMLSALKAVDSDSMGLVSLVGTLLSRDMLSTIRAAIAKAEGCE